ncbi:MAG: polyphosphate kinase 1 [Mariniphaga sp.]
MNTRLRSKEISWLSFNERLLQEATRNEVPLIERLKFLGIYSNNLDEFFRVRVAILRRLAMVGQLTLAEGGNPREILSQIEEIVVEHSTKFELIYNQILTELVQENIFIVNEKQLSPEQGEYVTQFFKREVRPRIMPIILKKGSKMPLLRDDAIYLAVDMAKNKNSEYALIEVPTDLITRFVIIPSNDDKTYIILLEDVIRYELNDTFYMFNYKKISSYIFKLTRDAELDLDDDVAESYVKLVAKSIIKRGNSALVRFVHEKEIPENLLSFLLYKLNFKKEDVVIGGSRIHNFKDFMEFPLVGSEHLYYKPVSPVKHKKIVHGQTYLNSISKGDILFHFPYHSFFHFIDLLREVSIDPKVTEIMMTGYRMARNSHVINALINAARNGKKVTMVLEIQARFNEQENIQYGNMLDKENVKVILGVPGLKVHSKLCLITRKEDKGTKKYAFVGTGNFNESTSKVFSDVLLCTADPNITAEVTRVFNFFERNYKIGRFQHLLVSPFTMRNKIVLMIKQEIANAKAGIEARIYLKCNNLVDAEIIGKIEEAAKCGVDVRLNVRGMFSMFPTSADGKVTIPAIGLIDRYLEHSRLFYFYDGGDEKVYISSSDFMTRNLDRRLEVAVPIYDKEIREELIDFFNLQWQDNTAARILDNDLNNILKSQDKGPRVKSQLEFYDYLRERNLR